MATAAMSFVSEAWCCRLVLCRRGWLRNSGGLQAGAQCLQHLQRCERVSIAGYDNGVLEKAVRLMLGGVGGGVAGVRYNKSLGTKR